MRKQLFHEPKAIEFILLNNKKNGEVLLGWFGCIVRIYIYIYDRKVGYML